MKSDEILSDLLLELEKRLMDPHFRRDREGVAALLHEDFREVGSSGRVWSRDEILAMLAAESSYAAPAIQDSAVRLLASDAVLVTYRAVRESGATLRSSVWMRDAGNWKMVFHQGTRMA